MMAVSARIEIGRRRRRVERPQEIRERTGGQGRHADAKSEALARRRSSTPRRRFREKLARRLPGLGRSRARPRVRDDLEQFGWCLRRSTPRGRSPRLRRHASAASVNPGDTVLPGRTGARVHGEGRHRHGRRVPDARNGGEDPELLMTVARHSNCAASRPEGGLESVAGLRERFQRARIRLRCSAGRWPKSNRGGIPRLQMVRTPRSPARTWPAAAAVLLSSSRACRITSGADAAGRDLRGRRSRATMYSAQSASGGRVHRGRRRDGSALHRRDLVAARPWDNRTRTLPPLAGDVGRAQTPTR